GRNSAHQCIIGRNSALNHHWYPLAGIVPQSLALVARNSAPSLVSCGGNSAHIIGYQCGNSGPIISISCGGNSAPSLVSVAGIVPHH
ncbi:unnamed protein product, partial [Staurois parvus]